MLRRICWVIGLYVLAGSHPVLADPGLSDSTYRPEVVKQFRTLSAIRDSIGNFMVMHVHLTQPQDPPGLPPSPQRIDNLRLVYTSWLMANTQIFAYRHRLTETERDSVFYLEDTTTLPHPPGAFRNFRQQFEDGFWFHEHYGNSLYLEQHLSPADVDSIRRVVKDNLEQHHIPVTLYQ